MGRFCREESKKMSLVEERRRIHGRHSREEEKKIEGRGFINLAWFSKLPHFFFIYIFTRFPNYLKTKSSKLQRFSQLTIP